MSKEKTVVLVVVIVFLFGATVFLVRNYFLEEATPAGSQNGGLAVGSSETYLEFPEDLFNDPRFIKLRQYGNTSIEVGEKGNKNPFNPF